MFFIRFFWIVPFQELFWRSRFLIFIQIFSINNFICFLNTRFPLILCIFNLIYIWNIISLCSLWNTLIRSDIQINLLQIFLLRRLKTTEILVKYSDLYLHRNCMISFNLREFWCLLRDLVLTYFKRVCDYCLLRICFFYWIVCKEVLEVVQVVYHFVHFSWGVVWNISLFLIILIYILKILVLKFSLFVLLGFQYLFALRIFLHWLRQNIEVLKWLVLNHIIIFRFWFL